MDIEKDEQVCGSCKDWKGKRELIDSAIFRVSTSTRGQCGRLNKPKPPHGGCGEWTPSEEE